MSATLKPPNYLRPDCLICFEPYSLQTLVYWKMNLPSSFVPRMWRSNKSQVLKSGYILFLMPEGWLIVWVIVTFLPEWRSWRDHERFSVICMLLAHLSGSLTSEKFIYYSIGGQNPAFKLLSLKEPVHGLRPSSTSRQCFNILTASMLFRDAKVGAQTLVTVF